MPKSAASCTDDRSFGFATIKNNPSSHVCAPSFDACMTVWLITEKCLRHVRHRYGIGRRSRTAAMLSDPQCGHTGPFGQRHASHCASAAVSSG